ncbi:MAG: HU family DNA-binding protein [Methyloligellaceae bacterium]
MNKKELIDRVSQVTSMSKDDVTTAVEATFDSIVTTLKEGGSVRIVGFGNFEVSQRKASTGRNPRTGEPMDIPASNVPKFKAGKALKEAVNS